MHKPFRAIGVTCEYVLYDFLLHLPYFAARTLLGPALYLFALGLGVGTLTRIGGSGYFEFILPGILMLTVMQVAYTHFSSEIWISRQVDKYLELLMMVAPIHPLEAVAGYLIAGVFISLFAVGCFLALAYLVLPGLSVSLPWIIAFGAGLGIFFTSLGIISGVSHTNPHHFSTTGVFILLPLSFLCGIFFPLDIYPKVVRLLVELIPLTQAVEGLRGNNPLIRLLYVWCTGLLVVFLSAWVFKRRLVS